MLLIFAQSSAKNPNWQIAGFSYLAMRDLVQGKLQTNMTKVQKISKNITPFAGVFFVNEEYKRSGLQNLIDTQLGKRASTKDYTYSNLIGNFFNLFLSGGECAEDIQRHFRSTLEQIPENPVASADTLLRVFGNLATENTTVVSSSNKKYEFNINEKLNYLNIKSLILTKQLKRGKMYDFDTVCEPFAYGCQFVFRRNYQSC
jgi:hypothetical protein